MAFIDFKDVSFYYQTSNQRIPIFDKFNLSIDKGESIVIYGRSGCGKTSLLNLLAGFLKPIDGSVVVNNKNISSLNENEVCNFRNKNIGYIFQFFNLINELTVYDNIALPQIILGLDNSEIKCNVEQITNKLKIQTRLKHYPYELSGGEQQRVAIARALINNPDIILADEPTGNLDRKSAENVIQILSSIQALGKTIITVTHDQSFVNLFDRVINLEEVTSVV